MEADGLIVLLTHCLRRSSLQCKTVYVRNIRGAVTEENIKEVFERFGAIEKVQKIKDFAFVHYEQRDDAVKVRFWC